MNNAITKLRSEMDANKNNSYIQVVGQFLLQHIESHPDDAEKIMTADKTIAKSLEAMRKEAEKKKSGNCAVLTDQEGFAIVLKYFGIEGAPEVKSTDVPVSQPQPEPAKAAAFDISLDDLL